MIIHFKHMMGIGVNFSKNSNFKTKCDELVKRGLGKTRANNTRAIYLRHK